MYDEYDEYGGSDPNQDGQEAELEELGGFQIDGGWGEEEDDDAEKFLAGYGMATAETLQLQRIGHLEPRIQAGVKAALSGDMPGVDPVDLAAARSVFKEVSGVENASFASHIKVDASVNIPTNKRDVGQVLSVLEKSSERYMDKGPGKDLPGNMLSEDGQYRADTKLREAFDTVDDLADLYLAKATAEGPLAGVTKERLSGELMQSLMDSTAYKGSEAAVPLPNELGEKGIFGLVRTQGIYQSRQGTAEGRVSAAGRFEHLYDVTGSGPDKVYARDERGFKKFRADASQEDVNEALRGIPNLKNTLFPTPTPKRGQKFTAEESAVHSSAQSLQYNSMMSRVAEARSTLVAEMPTNRNESAGEGRYIGFDTPDGEQADAQNLRNEAELIGLGWNDRATENTTDVIGNKSYSQSMVEEAAALGVSTAEEFEIAQSREDEVFIGPQKPELTGPEQLTAEWFRARKGKITASTIGEVTGKFGVERAAIKLAMERHGTGKPFSGNADTKEGQQGEDKARRAFLANEGKGMEFSEAPFIENEAHPGMGVSPDGMLKVPGSDGEEILELKFLSEGRMKGAANRYRDQVQFQLAIADKKVGHFYALDKNTGKSVYERMEADPARQEVLLDVSNRALELAAGLGEVGVRDLRNEIASRKARNNNDSAGQDTPFKAKGTTEEIMTPYRPEGSVAEEVTTSKAAGDSLSEAIQDLSESMDSMHEEANRENSRLDEEAKRAADALSGFTKSARDAIKVLGEVGGAVMSGNTSGMDEVRLAAKTGTDVNQLRGIRNLLTSEGGLDEAGVSRTFADAASMRDKFSTMSGSAKEWARIQYEFGATEYDELASLPLPGISQQTEAAKDPTKSIAMVQGILNQVEDPAARAVAAGIFGFSDMAASEATAEGISEAFDDRPAEEALRLTQRGIQGGAGGLQDQRALMEGAGSVGETLGNSAAVATGVAAVAGSVTAELLGKKLLGGSKGGKSVGGVLSSPGARKLAGVAKSIPFIGAAVIGAGSVVDSAVTSGEAGSKMDAMQSAAPFDIPAFFDYEHAAVPETGIGTIPSQATSQSAPPKPVVNLEVTNEISPDLIKTTVDNDGEISINEETGISTGG